MFGIPQVNIVGIDGKPRIMNPSLHFKTFAERVNKVYHRELNGVYDIFIQNLAVGSWDMDIEIEMPDEMFSRMQEKFHKDFLERLKNNNIELKVDVQFKGKNMFISIHPETYQFELDDLVREFEKNIENDIYDMVIEPSTTKHLFNIWSDMLKKDFIDKISFPADVVTVEFIDKAFIEVNLSKVLDYCLVDSVDE